MGDGELEFWFARECLHPTGERAADLRAGIIASTFFNALIRPDTWLSAIDFIPWRKPVVSQEDKEEEITQSVIAFAKAFAVIPPEILERNRREARSVRVQGNLPVEVLTPEQPEAVHHA